MAEMAEAEKAWPHNSSVIALTFRVETPCTLGSSPRAGSHLGQRRHERLLGALIAFEEFGREPPVSVLRHAQLELAHPGDEGAAVIAGAVTEPGCGALALFGPERVGHLGFQHLLHHRANDLAQAVRALRKEFVDGGDRGLSFTLGHDGVPHRESVTSTSPACHDRLSPSAILQNLQHTTRARLKLAGVAAPDQVFGLAWSGARTKMRLARLIAHVPRRDT